MPQLRSFSTDQLPRELALQIRSYQRIQWPQLRALNAGPAQHFVVLDGELLVSHASVNTRSLQHGGQTFKVCGLSGVFTYPDYRRAGFAGQVVRAATQYILDSGADVAMLFCDRALEPLYGGCGWSPVDAQVLYGDRERPSSLSGNIVMMLFVSATGRAARTLFEQESLYVGERTW